MNNKGLLTVIAVILIGIFTVVLIQANDQTPAEEISDNVSNAIEEASENIEINTNQ